MARDVRRARGERGLADSVQWAILTPLLLVTLLGLVQVGLWLPGRTIAPHAAIAAAEDAALLGSGPDAGAVARAIAGAGGLTDVTVTVSRGARTAEVDVSGRMPTFFDLGQGRVSARATRPLERVTSP